jgi:mannosyl-oligosaccharide alpha-1,2-mannosidase
MGALGDSFYEYLLKAYIQTGDTEARQMYDDAMDAFEQNGLIRYSKSGLMYFAEMKYDRIESKMDHLACFGGNDSHKLNTFAFYPQLNVFSPKLS